MEIDYIPVGKVKRRKKQWIREATGLLASIATVVAMGVLAGAGFGLGLALASAWI